MSYLIDHQYVNGVFDCFKVFQRETAKMLFYRTKINDQERLQRKPNPAFTLIAENELFRIDDLSQYFDRVHYTRPRTIKVLVAISNVEAVVFYGFQISE